MDLKSIITGDDTLRIEPPRATLGQLQLTNRLQMVRIADDVTGVAESLKRIDRGLVLMFDKGQRIYVLYHEAFNKHGEWVETFVGAYQELDQRIVNLIRRLDAQGSGHYDLQRELTALEARKDREHEREVAESFGPMAERLRHALRVDLGATGSSVAVGDRVGARAARKRRQQGTRR